MTAGAAAQFVPITSQTPSIPDAPHLVRVPVRKSGLDQESWALAHQVQTVDKQFVGDYAGRIAPDVMAALDDALRYVLQLDCP